MLFAHARRSRFGQTALSTVFLIGGIIVLYATSLAVIGISFLNSAFGFQAANRALAVAAGGVHDAELQLMRNKDFEDTSGYCVPAANLPCPSGYAEVRVTQGSGRATVTSDATVARRRRKLQANLSISTSTGAVVFTSSTPLSF